MKINLLAIVTGILFLSTCNADNINNGDKDQPGEPLTLTVDFEETFQTVHGFGASDAWSVQYVGKNWPLQKREQMADLLFSSSLNDQGNPEGIGLSIWRFNIGGGSARQGAGSGINDPWRRAESFLAADSTYDWSRQKGQQWFLQAAADRGVDNFIGFVNSPPVLLTKTGKAYGDGSAQANIRPEHYDEFADYLARIADHFKQKGTPLTYLSPVNEPQWDWAKSNGQEGSPYQNDQMDGVIKALDQKLQEYNLDTQIEIPETAQIDFLFDGNLPGRNKQVDHFFGPQSEVSDLPTLAKKMAAHSYFTTWPVEDMIAKREKVWESIQNADTPIEYWMSEYCILANNEEIKGGGRDLGINPALYIARVLHFDMTIANASSWQWWLAISPYDFKDGLVYIDKSTQNGSVYESKMLWGLGNYSHFIRPGATRVGVSRSDHASPEEAARSIMVSAYRQDTNNKATLVLVNYSTSEQEADLQFEKLGGKSVASIVPYVTSSYKNLERDDSLVSDQTIKIPARSILTLQVDLSNE